MTTAQYSTSPAPALAPHRRFAVRASDELPARVARLRDASDAGAELVTLRGLASDAAQAWVDAVLDGFIANLAALVRGPGTSSGQRTMALARGVADRVIAQGARRAEAQTIAQVLAFFSQHVLALPAGPAIAFTIDDELAAALTPVLESAADDAGLRSRVAIAMHATIDRALHHLFDVPVGLLGLGTMARAAIAVGRAGLAGRAHRSVDSALATDGAITRMAGFLARSVIAAPTSI